jgi:hypothetical protein
MPIPDHSFQKPAREEANRVELATPWIQVVQNLGHSGELFQMICKTDQFRSMAISNALFRDFAMHPSLPEGASTGNSSPAVCEVVNAKNR